MNRLAQPLVALALFVLSSDRLLAQTFDTTRAVHEVKCRTYLGVFNKCVTIETDRIHSTFTRNTLGGRYLFGRTWATASHCTRLDSAEEKCKRSVFISTDAEWNRIIWGQSDTFLRTYGAPGTPADGPGHLGGPLGVDITRREGEWHVGLIADARNNRIVVLAVGYTCKCVRWLGTLDGSESGTPLGNPHDVAWDHVDTWSLADDRVFIADTDNDRILVYQVSLNPVAGTMTKAYLGSFGSHGQGPNQFSHPQGLTVRSISAVFQVPWGEVTILSTYVYVSDTDNHRVSAWFYEPDNTATPAAQSGSIPGSEFVGITHDYYGDVIVADRARDVLVKFAHFDGGATLAPLKTYGATPSWSTGNFNDPTDAAVIPHYWQNASGQLIQERLPYVQTVEAWTATTGGQLHHLGIDAEELAVTPGQCEATFTFLLTAYGDYNLKVKNAGGGVLASWSRTGVGSGRKSEFWNAQGQSAGAYSYVVEHRNAYGDETAWRTSTGPSFNLNCFTVTAGVPASISQGGTYGISGSSSHPADNWSWEKSYAFYTNEQHSSFYVPNDPGAYTIDWHLTARRTSDGASGSDFRSTNVSIVPEPPPCPNPPCMDQTAPIPGGTTPGRRITPPQAQLVRQNHHVGSGAWIARRTATGGAVQQLYSFTGRHQARAPLWPNVLSGDGQTVLESRTLSPAYRVVFTRHTIDAGDAYRARFLVGTSHTSGLFVGLAFDPELGTRSGDDSLGFDAQTGLIWVVDRDSGAIGYMVTDVPLGARVTVRQFSTRTDAWRPDPVSDSAAYAEISASDVALTGKPGDVRLLIAIGPVPSSAQNVDVGFVMLAAPSLAALRERAAGTAGSVLSLFADDTISAAPTGAIARFHLTQAPPDPMAPEGVRPISPALVPGLSTGTGSTIAGSDQATLRDAVRRYGITALAFAVPDGPQATVKVRIYDPAGRLIRTLVDDTYPSGAYRAQWDLKDHRGRGVAPGVYIAIMEAPGFRAMTRLVVVP